MGNKNITIGIDIRLLGTGRKTGIEEYTERILDNMLPLDGNIKYKLFYSSHSNTLPSYPWVSLPNVSVYNFRIPSRLLFYSSRFTGYPKIDRLLGGVDVFFSPHFFIAPLSKNVARVLTIHDLSFKYFSEFFSSRQRLWHSLAMSVPTQINRAKSLIAVSDSTATDLQKLYYVPTSKINKIYSGAPEPMNFDGRTINEFKRNYKLLGRYILALGTFEPRKNLSSLIGAFNFLKQDDRYADVGLVLVGELGWKCGDMEEAVAKSSFRKDIQIIKGISGERKALYYAAASVFVYPSFFEGFGFPPLEAMAYGTPVVASFTTSLSEIVGEAGVLIDPYSVRALTAAIQGILDDEDLRKRMIKRGREQIKRFPWDISARKTLEVLLRG